MSVDRRPRKTLRLPEVVDVHRDQVVAFVQDVLGHDPKDVLRVRIGPREIQVDLLARRNVKVTVTHSVVGAMAEDET